MQDFDITNKNHVLPIIIKYLVKNELYKSAKKLKIESKLDLEAEEFPIYEKKLESIIGFYSEYWKALGEPGKRKGSIRKASSEIQNLTQVSKPVIVKKQAKNGKEDKTKEVGAKKINGKDQGPKKKKVIRKVIKKIKKKKVVPKKVVVNKPKAIAKKKMTEVVKAKTEIEQEPIETKPAKKKITKKEKQQKIEKKRIQKQQNYQNFKETSEANTLVNKKLQSRVNRGNVFTRCANVKNVKYDLFDSKWSNKVRKGGQDAFGSLGFERLGGTRGKNFRKEKTKLKNREFQGSKITFRNNLIDLD
jgi:hypothetical protein